MSGRHFNPFAVPERSHAAARAQGAPAARCLDDDSGRQFNPLLDFLGSRSQRTEDVRAKDSRIQLQCEMAKAKDYALQLLREEHLDTSDSRPRTKVPTASRATRLCSRSEQDKEVCNSNMQPCVPADKGRRSLEAERNITFRRLNLPTPKRQRPLACSTPVSYVIPHSSVQRMPKVCPRPTQPTSVSPSRIISTAGVRHPASEQPTPPRYSVHPTDTTNNATPPRYPVHPRDTANTSAGRYPIHTRDTANTSAGRYPVRPADAASSSPGTITTETTTTTTRPFSPQQTANMSVSMKQYIRSPNTSPERSSSRAVAPPYGDLTRRQDSQQPQNNNGSVTHNTRLQMDSAYGRTPPRTFTPYTFQTPGRSLNVTQEQSTNTSLQQRDVSTGSPTSVADNSQLLQTTSAQDRSMPISDQALLYQMQAVPSPPGSPNQDQNNETYRQLQQRLYRSREQSKSPAQRAPPTATNESYYYNPSMFDEPSHYRRNPSPECPSNDYIDLTDSQYNCNDMDLSVQEIPEHSTYPTNREQSRQMQSWTIASDDDVICLDTTTDVRSPATNETLETTGFESNEYPEILSHLEAPCDQPRATLLRCLGQKLNSTFDFITSLVAPERAAGALAQTMDQAEGQVRDEPSETASARECTTAKRCGRIKFDSPDRPEDPHRSVVRKAETENLVKDTYCPGIIQDTIDGRKNFNDYSFKISLAAGARGGTRCEWPPTEDPMSLLEAFFMRIEKEREQIKKDIKENSTNEKIAELVHQYFDKENPSDLNRSIKSLLLSERLQEHEKVEKSKGTSLQAEVQKWVSKWPKNAKVEVKAYTGLTRPLKEDEIV